MRIPNGDCGITSDYFMFGCDHPDCTERVIVTKISNDVQLWMHGWSVEYRRDGTITFCPKHKEVK